MTTVPTPDLGRPIAYLALKEGTPVFDKAGERVGVVEHVLADEDLDIFHGLVVHTKPIGGRHLYADADQLAGMYEDGVLLAVGVDDLHEPTDPSSPRPAQTDRPADNALEARLRHAWDWITGNR
jgi:hypothetical protein